MSKINKSDIYEKNLNFLVGSGASYGLLPTLALKVKKNGSDETHTVETLATKYEEDHDFLAHLFSWYVQEIILPAAEYDPGDVSMNTEQQNTAIDNYRKFLETILNILSKKSHKKRANIFTTNYDGMIAHTAEALLRLGSYDFHLNNGTDGFVKRTLNARNFGRYFQDHGVFDRHSKSVPQINLIELHGSVYWYKDGEKIEVSYDLDRAKKRMSKVPLREDQDFFEYLMDATKTDEDLNPPPDITLTQNDAFQNAYKALPIVNPTKWKFYETVFEEHYYQMMRLLSYELEKPDTVFIAFGFSFADEHILNLIKRSLSNPSLHMYVCCFNDDEKHLMEQKFLGFANVELIRVDGALDFTAFNDEVFTTKPASA
ncbi:SIR2 family protein [Nitratireductor sp. L1-7-SE]|uniref:SIR2 family protein n=1 Tax=Nitratireductor rhodophyticola TaxID=2854036 RepID=A0ABS7R759_9HYPH|nr:SIR2 family protein [Nitratireductor rhodophyticola]MBY8916770.1 SIR2 family protein [Nitratireductor rhodophyticola]MBY8920801.1 SIR2 family protein [Nitratireductor rhodophyticola]